MVKTWCLPSGRCWKNSRSCDFWPHQRGATLEVSLWTSWAFNFSALFKGHGAQSISHIHVVFPSLNESTIQLRPRFSWAFLDILIYLLYIQYIYIKHDYVYIYIFIIYIYEWYGIAIKRIIFTLIYISILDTVSLVPVPSGLVRKAPERKAGIAQRIEWAATGWICQKFKGWMVTGHDLKIKEVSLLILFRKFCKM